MRYVLGIDPGLKGGLAFLGEDHSLLKLAPMPTQPGDSGKGSLRIDTRFILELVEIYGTPTKLFVEMVGVNPKWRKKGIFTFGRVYEALLVLCDLAGYPYDVLPPKTWQSELLKGTKYSGCPKPAVMAWANRAHGLKLKMEKEGDDGLSDALGIAEVGWRRTFSAR